MRNRLRTLLILVCLGPSLAVLLWLYPRWGSFASLPVIVIIAIIAHRQAARDRVARVKDGDAVLIVGAIAFLIGVAMIMAGLLRVL